MLYQVELLTGEGAETTLQGVRAKDGEYEMSLRTARATVRQLAAYGLDAAITNVDTGERVPA